MTIDDAITDIRSEFVRMATVSGHDILVLRRAEAPWCVVCRTMVPAPS